MGKYTYENQGSNTFLVYSMEPYERIDPLAAGMAANNRLSGVLAPGFTQKNMERQLRYNISSKISLEQYFSGSVKKKQLVGVLKSITHALLNAEKYLLDEDSFLLDRQHIFVDVGRAEGYLLCFPVEKREGMGTVFYEFLRQLIYGIKFEETENCAYIAVLMNYINRREDFSYEGFLRVLQGIGDEGRQKAQMQEMDVPQQPERQRAIMTKPLQAVKPGYAPGQPETEHGHVSGQPEGQSGGRSAQAHTAAPKPYETLPLPEPEKKEEKKKGFHFPFGKKQEEGEPPEKKKEKPEKKKAAKKQMNFQIPGSPSKPMGFKTQPEAAPAQSVPELPTAEQAVSKQPVLSVPFSAGPAEKPSAPQQPGPAEPGRSREVPGAEEMEDFGNTVMMGDNEDGVTVISGSGIQDGARRRVVLTRLKNGQKMTIEKELFRIGKSSSFVDFYVGDNRTVSRSHADILLQNGGVYIQDNNSLNHTFVNERMVLAGEQQLLSDGDKIRLSDEEFVISIQNG